LKSTESTKPRGCEVRHFWFIALFTTSDTL
jgi:hypothetical protein